MSASVVSSVVLESVMECRMRGNDVFCDVSVSGTIRSGMSVQLEKKPLTDANARFELADP